MTATMARLEARIDPDVHRLIKRAAALRGSTVTDFVVTAARLAAQQAVEEATLLHLSREDQRPLRGGPDDPSPGCAGPEKGTGSPETAPGGGITLPFGPPFGGTHRTERP